MYTFNVPEMTCGGCAGAVTQALRAVDPKATVHTDLPSKTVSIQSATPGELLAAAIRDAGFSAVKT